MASTIPIAPPDREQRERALDPDRSVLVRAPAGSGKTDLLTRRFLKLLGRVDEPSQVVAITFTRAAAAEMRHRIVTELEKAALHPQGGTFIDKFSMEALADEALRRSRALGWELLEIPAQLQISTIDSFCRELALQQPLLSGIGGSLEVAEQPMELYRRAARYTLEHLRDTNPSPRIGELQRATEALLLWRDNNWVDVEDQLVSMLQSRDQWMHDFVLDHDPDWEALRDRLERPFARTVAGAVTRVATILSSLPHACNEALELARFICGQKNLHRDLAEIGECPCGPFEGSEDVESARRAYACLAEMLLTKEGAVRKSVDVRNGFPAHHKREKDRMNRLLAEAQVVPGLKESLHAIRELPGVHYEEAEWEIVRASFTLLRHAAAELKVIFAESGTVDFVEVAQLAQHVLREPDGTPSDAAIAVADRIRHLLIDEFQDTSRRQHTLVASLVAAWPDTEGRSVFVVGDPMQSIYGFRDADAELFPRVQNFGLDLPDGQQLVLDSVELSANFRTAPELIEPLNEKLETVFAQYDGSNVPFSAARAIRPQSTGPGERLHLHLAFVAQAPRRRNADAETREECIRLRREAQATQVDEVVALIREREQAVHRASERGDKYRIAILGRTRTALTPIATALRAASIPFRAVDLEGLAERPEVRDALALVRAFLMPEDRVAWLGVLRAPWCGLSLEDLHRLTSGDDEAVRRRPITELLAERRHLLSDGGQRGVDRVQHAWEEFRELRATSITATSGTLMEQAWRRVGGDACVDAAGKSNLQLLWSSLDRLPSGEAGLLSGELDAGLGNLMAQSDPEADGNCGVQLMTIHKSKGLEFEVVIVPELQATQRHSELRMLSWMERGLAEPGDDGSITEFLVAPLGPKGGERGSVKRWVDDALRTRETQEMRRILYVAATRAREELHFFARPFYKAEDDGRLELCNQSGSLLATAWPALEDEIRARFDAWQSGAEESTLTSVAAVAQVIQMPGRKTGTILRRLPIDYDPPTILHAGSQQLREVAGPGITNLYRRHEGGIASRALGTAVHFLLEKAAQLCAQMEMSAMPGALLGFKQRTSAHTRSFGLDRAQAEKVADDAMEIVLRACEDSNAKWMLHPHLDAASEAAWTGEMDGVVRTVRADRVFRAGDAPGTVGAETWWVIDYKTAHPESADAARIIPELRPLFAPQLEVYAAFLRKLHGDDIDVRAGLYYPRLAAFDWWTA